MSEPTTDAERRVASGFPRPDDVPGPTERLRRLHGDAATEPGSPRFGRTSVEHAATDDVASMDEMLKAQGPGSRAADAIESIALRVAEETATRLRSELERRGLSQSLKSAGFGAVEVGGAALLGVVVVGTITGAAVDALSTVMPRWAAGLTTVGLCSVPAAFLALSGRRQLAQALRTATVQASS